MLEILFLVGVFGVAVGSAGQFIYELDAFPSILAGLLIAPPLGYSCYLNLLHRYGLEGLHARARRKPVPPERFYWTVRRARLRLRAGGLALLGGAAWAAAVRFPARLSTDPGSTAGWLAGVLAIVATADATASGLIFARATEWFDGTRTRLGGRVRRVIYRLSGDAELLDPDPLPGAPEKVRRQRSVY